MLSTHKCIYQLTPRLTSLLGQQPKLYSISQFTSNLQVHACSASNVPQLNKSQPKQAFLKQPIIPYKYYSMQHTPKIHSPEDKAENEVKTEQTTPAPATYKEKLKQAVAQYGSTVIVFHVTISLMSLGICYMVVASGLDVSMILDKLGLSTGSVNKLATSSGTFAAAYLVHKVFAPVRISITLTCTPFIVRYLRKIGLIKKALPKVEGKQ